MCPFLSFCNILVLYSNNNPSWRRSATETKMVTFEYLMKVVPDVPETYCVLSIGYLYLYFILAGKWFMHTILIYPHIFVLLVAINSTFNILIFSSSVVLLLKYKETLHMAVQNPFQNRNGQVKSVQWNSKVESFSPVKQAYKNNSRRHLRFLCNKMQNPLWH